MRRLIVFLLICTAFGLQAGETPDQILGSLPPALGECERGDLQAYGDPKLGFSVEYRQPGVLVAVFAYDLGQKAIPDGIDGKAVRDAYQAALGEVKDAERQGFYKEVVKRDEGQITPVEGHPVLRARYHLTRLWEMDSGKRCCSEIEVFGARGMIIKVRATSTLQNEVLQQKAMGQFLPALVEALKNPPKAPSKSETPKKSEPMKAPEDAKKDKAPEVPKAP